MRIDPDKVVNMGEIEVKLMNGIFRKSPICRVQNQSKQLSPETQFHQTLCNGSTDCSWCL